MTSVGSAETSPVADQPPAPKPDETPKTLPGEPKDPQPATMKVAEPTAIEPGHSAAVSPTAPTPSQPAPAAQATPPADEASTPPDPGEKIGAIIESVGTEIIESFYRSESIDERGSYVIEPEVNQPLMEAYYRRSQSLPTLRSVSFRGPMRDAASGRWFGVFDVREKENEELHRWCVVQIRPGDLKLDWTIYQQLIDESLDRFLADPASPPKEFSLVVRKGDEAPSDENPWQGTTYEVYLQPPLDTAQARVVMVRDADFEKLGLKNALIGGNARIGRVELSWAESEIEPMTRVPTISKVLKWGAW